MDGWRLTAISLTYISGMTEFPLNCLGARVVAQLRARNARKVVTARLANDQRLATSD